MCLTEAETKEIIDLRVKIDTLPFSRRGEDHDDRMRSRLMVLLWKRDNARKRKELAKTTTSCGSDL